MRKIKGYPIISSAKDINARGESRISQINKKIPLATKTKGIDIIKKPANQCFTLTE
ncbi:hypothetical protein GCM10027035_51020 [Emticicia sediminis]